MQFVPEDSSAENLFRGNRVEAMVNRLAAIAGREYDNGRACTLEQCSWVSMTEMPAAGNLLQRSSVEQVIRKTMVGRRLQRSFESSGGATHLALVKNPSGRYVEAAALLRKGNPFYDTNQQKVIHEPYIAVEAFGVPTMPNSAKVNANVLRALSTTIMKVAERISTALYSIEGTYGAPPFTPAVYLECADTMRPTILAEEIHLCVQRYRVALHAVEQAPTKIGTGFSEKLEAVAHVAQEFVAKFPGHALVEYFTTVLDKRVFDAVDTEESSYRRMQKIAGATRRLIHAVENGIHEFSDQLFPGAYEEHLEIVDAYDDEDGQGFGLCYPGGRFSMGKAALRYTNLSDPHPTVEFSGQDGTGIISNLSSILLQKATQGKWLRQQVK